MNCIAEKPTTLMNSPRKVDIAITGRCNLRCIYCYHFDSPGDVSDDLSTDEWLQFFEELNRASVLEVNLSGGEIFIREDYKEIIESVVKNRMRFSINTNGTLLTNEIAGFLASTNRCNSVQVSLDGPSGEIHDKNCGRGSFDRAINGLKILKKHGLKRAVRLTITKNNVSYLEKSAKVLLEDVGMPSFSTNSACPFGLSKKNADIVQLSPNEYTIAMNAHYNIIKKYGNRVNAQAGPLSSFKHWTDMDRMVKEKTPPKPGGGYLTSCGGVFNKIAIRADGIIIPCNILSHIELGRINRDSFIDTWKNHPELKRLRDRRQIQLSEFEYCKSCVYQPYCRGGCPAGAHALTGDENVPVPGSDSCYKRFKEEGGVLPVFE